MSKNIRIQSKGNLLSNDGSLLRKGYATSFQFDYNRKDIHCSPIALKEWDFFQFMEYPYLIQATIGHVSYATNASFTFIDLRNGRKEGISLMKAGRRVKLDLDPEKDSDILVKSHRNCLIHFIHKGDKRIIEAKGVTQFKDELSFHLEFLSPSSNEKMVIATPFNKKNQFYLNYKENYYSASGTLTIGGKTRRFKKMDGLLDWGRGVWPYRHEWYWSSLSCYVDGKPFGLNLGWGFGDLSNATENMFFYGHKAHKVDELLFEHDLDKPMSRWHLYDKEGNLNLYFTPFYDNYTENKMVVVDTHCDQTFGYYEGSVRIGSKIVDIGKPVAFLEHAVNKW